MRVIHVIPSISRRTGGAADFVLGAARALLDLGHETSIWTTDMDRPASSANRHHRLGRGDLPDDAHGIPLRIFTAARPLRFAYARGLGSALRDEIDEADLLHVHSLFLYPQLTAARQAARSGTPYVVSIHGSLDPYIRRRGRIRKALVNVAWQRRMLQHAAALHTTADAEAALISDVAPGTPREVIPVGLDLSIFDRVSERDGVRFRTTRLNAHGGPIVLNVGRVSEKKGIDALIRAFASVVERGKSAQLVIAGPDDEGLTPGLERLAGELGVGGFVTFVGMLDRHEMVAALRAADVWALPSRTENFGIAVVEAMAAGLPAVVSPEVNIARDLADAGAAILAPGTPEAFSEAIEALLLDDKMRRDVGERAREYAQRYDWSVVGPELVGMYERATPANAGAIRSATWSQV